MPDQADVDKVKWLQANKYYTAKEYANFTPAEKAWICQNRTEDREKSPKRKVAAVRRDDNNMDKSDDGKSLFGDDDKSVSSKRSNAKNPALARQQGKKPKN